MTHKQFAKKELIKSITALNRAKEKPNVSCEELSKLIEKGDHWRHIIKLLAEEETRC